MRRTRIIWNVSANSHLGFTNSSKGFFRFSAFVGNFFQKNALPRKPGELEPRNLSAAAGGIISVAINQTRPEKPENTQRSSTNAHVLRPGGKTEEHGVGELVEVTIIARDLIGADGALAQYVDTHEVVDVIRITGKEFTKSSKAKIEEEIEKRIYKEIGGIGGASRGSARVGHIEIGGGVAGGSHGEKFEEELGDANMMLSTDSEGKGSGAAAGALDYFEEIGASVVQISGEETGISGETSSFEEQTDQKRPIFVPLSPVFTLVSPDTVVPGTTENFSAVPGTTGAVPGRTDGSESQI